MSTGRTADIRTAGAGRALTPSIVLRLALATAAAALSEACAIALTATSVWLVCRAAEQPPLGTLMIAVAAVRALALGRGALRYAERLWGHDAALRVMERLRGRLLDALAPLAPFGLRAFTRGDLLGRLVSDVDAVQDALLRVALPALTALLVGSGVIVWSASVLPAAGWVLGAGLFLTCVALPLLAAVSGHRATTRLSAARAELAARTVDVVEGVEDLALCGATEAVVERERAASRDVARRERAQARTAGALSAAAVAVQLSATAAVAVFALRGTDAVTAAVLTLTALSALELGTPVRTAGEHLGRLGSALRRLRDLPRAPVPSAPTSPSPGGASPYAPPEPPVALELTRVTVRHPGAHRPVLEDFDLSLAPGRSVALVGPSGSGKSTVVAVALGLLAATGGRAAIGGVPFGALADTALRPRLVAGLTQYHHVFAGTVREHLLLARPTADEDGMWSALEQAGAGRWVRSLPGGLDARVAEDAAAFSGGERRRLGLAAALLADPAVLVLDEPTESLAPRDADAVLAAAIPPRPDRAVLLVSHRTIALEAVDEIVVLREGRVAQRGTHAELLAAPGYYRDRHRAELAAEYERAAR